MFNYVAEILYFVKDRRAAAEWCSKLFGIEITWLDDREHFLIRVGSQEVWFPSGDRSMNMSKCLG
jgi:hypothetical protein